MKLGIPIVFQIIWDCLCSAFIIFSRSLLLDVIDILSVFYFISGVWVSVQNVCTIKQKLRSTSACSLISIHVKLLSRCGQILQVSYKKKLNAFVTFDLTTSIAILVDGPCSTNVRDYVCCHTLEKSILFFQTSYNEIILLFSGVMMDPVWSYNTISKYFSNSRVNYSKEFSSTICGILFSILPIIMACITMFVLSQCHVDNPVSMGPCHFDL